MSSVSQLSFKPAQRQLGCSHQVILNWFHTHLPEQSEENDTLVYHNPIPPWRDYIPQRMWTSCAVLSLTPTEGVYQHLHQTEPPRKMLFLHRPWGLDRKRVPRGSVVLQSHKHFDELYTTGYNLAFAAKHGVDMTSVQCLRGFKDDPKRRIGLLGRLENATKSKLYAQNLMDDFGGCELQQGMNDDELEIWAIASLNAFTEEIVQRVQDRFPDIPMANVLCVTGAAREAGLKAARERGMQVMCLGHRRTEMWGLKFLATKILEDLGLATIIVDEPDFVFVRKDRAEIDRKDQDTAKIRASLSQPY